MSRRQTAANVRRDIEDALVQKCQSALTPRLRTQSERFSCGIEDIDHALQGGIPIGAITEIVGPECSGRTTMALAYVAACTQKSSVAAWVDVNDVLSPECAAMSGVDLNRLLWIRCSSSSQPQETVVTHTEIRPRSDATSEAPVPKGGGSPHPRSEGRGMSSSIQQLFTVGPRSNRLPKYRRNVAAGTPSAPNYFSAEQKNSEEQIATDRLPSRRQERIMRMQYDLGSPRPDMQPVSRAASSRLIEVAPNKFYDNSAKRSKRNWSPLDKALKATDLLLQAGGFSCVVLDFGSTLAEMSWRVPLATWFRYRAACERSRISLVLLTRYACARSSAELVMRMEADCLEAQGNVLTGISFRATKERQRFEQPTKVICIRKPPQSAGAWKGRAAWAV